MMVLEKYLKWKVILIEGNNNYKNDWSFKILIVVLLNY